MKRVCFTGHRDIRPEDITYIKTCLRLTIRREIREGTTNFMCGLANGVDIYAARIIYEEKKEFPWIVLEGAAPYRGRLNSKDAEIREIVNLCDKIEVISEKSTRSCYQERNKFMVDSSYKVVAVYDGRQEGGTYNTIEYAKKAGKEVFVIDTRETSFMI